MVINNPAEWLGPHSAGNMFHVHTTQLYDHYELHIYTMGTRAYARMVAGILDETGNLFGDRILSRDDGFDQACIWTLLKTGAGIQRLQGQAQSDKGQSLRLHKHWVIMPRAPESV